MSHAEVWQGKKKKKHTEPRQDLTPDTHLVNADVLPPKDRIFPFSEKKLQLTWNLVIFFFQEGQIPGKVELREEKKPWKLGRLCWTQTSQSSKTVGGKMLSGPVTFTHPLLGCFCCLFTRLLPHLSPRGFGSNRPSLPRKPMKARKSHCPSSSKMYLFPQHLP